MANGAEQQQKKGLSPLAWVGIGCGGLVVLVIIAVIGMAVVGGMMVKKVAEDSGFTLSELSEDAEKNPGIMAAKMMAALDPDVEFVSADEDEGTVTFRDKESGKTVTVDFSDLEKGEIRFEDDQGETMNIQTSGDSDSGSMTITTDDGEMVMTSGQEAELPDWVPAYPGSKAQGVLSTKSAEGVTGTAAFDTQDSPEKVLAYYEKKLKKEGFEIHRTGYSVDGESAGGLVSATREAEGMHLNVTCGEEDGKTAVILSYGHE